MSFQLEALRDKPIGWWQLDDTTPYQDYSGFDRAGTQTGTQVKHAALANGCAYAPVFSRDAVGSFTAPVFEQGKEYNSFSLEVVFRPIIKTVGYEAMPVRENLFLNPSFEVDTSNWSAVSSTATSVATRAWGTKGVQIAGTITTSRLEVTTQALEPGTYTASIYYYIVSSGDGHTSFPQITSPDGDATITINYNDGKNVTNTNPWSVWNRTIATFTVSTTEGAAARVRLRWYTGGYTVIFDAAQLERGDVATPYFDGSMPGASWSGAANASTSKTNPEVGAVNLALNPRGIGTNGPNNNNSFWTLSYNVALPLATPDGIYSGVRSTVSSASALSFLMSTYNLDGYNNLPLFRYIGYWVMTPHSGYEVKVSNNNVTTYTPLVPNQWLWVNEDTTGYAGAVVRKINAASNAPIGDSVYVTGVTVSQHAPPTKFFDGTTPGAVWAGAVNQSGSVMLASDAEQQILGNLGQYDGLTIDGTIVSFKTKNTDGSVVSASYDLKELRRVHLAGVHTAGKNSLYVDGELVSEADIIEPGTYVATSPDLYSGHSNSSRALAVNGIGVYNHALSPQAVARHSQHSSYTMTTDSVAEAYGGIRIPLADALMTTLFSTTFDSWDEWDDGRMNNLTLDNNSLIQDDIFTIGSWHNAIALDPVPATSIQGVRFYWQGYGVLLDVSLDGETWERVEQGKMPTLIPAGFNPTDKSLLIRASLPSHDEGDNYRLDSLTFEIIGSTSSKYHGFSITTTPGVKIRSGGTPISMRDSWGVELDGAAATITPSPTSMVTKTVEVWVKSLLDGPMPLSYYLLDLRDASHVGYPYLYVPVGKSTLQFGGMSATLYVNGQPAGASDTFALRKNEWTLLHLTTTMTDVVPINVGQRYSLGERGKFEVSDVSLYDRTLTAAEINNIYRSYLGQPAVRAADTGIISVTEPVNAGSIYVHDWSIQAAG